MDRLLTEERAYDKYNVSIMKGDIGNNIVALSTVFTLWYLHLPSLDNIFTWQFFTWQTSWWFEAHILFKKNEKP